jgi:hypothetical protein
MPQSARRRPKNAEFPVKFPIRTHGDAVRNLIDRVAMIEMVGPVLTRALQPFPVPVRTLDAIHLAALEFIRAQKQSVQLASYDDRLIAAARLLGITEWSGSQ